MANKKSKQKSKPGKWWQIVAGILLFIFCVPLAFYLLMIPNSNWAVSLFFIVFGLPTMGAALFVGAILSAIYIAKYRPKGKYYNVPAMVIVLAFVATCFTVLFFVDQEMISNQAKTKLENTQASIKQQEEYVSSIFRDLGAEGYFDARHHDGGLAAEDAKRAGYKGVSYVSGAYFVNSNFNNYQQGVRAKLAQKGFTQESDSSGRPYFFVVNPSDYKRGYVVFRYLNENESIIMKYILKAPFDCTPEYDCYYLPGVIQQKQPFNLEKLNNLQLNSVVARYSDIANSKDTEFEIYYP